MTARAALLAALGIAAIIGCGDAPAATAPECVAAVEEYCDARIAALCGEGEAKPTDSCRSRVEAAAVHPESDRSGTGLAQQAVTLERECIALRAACG